jgi:transposase
LAAVINLAIENYFSITTRIFSLFCRALFRTTYERLPKVVHPYGRKTTRLEKALQVIAFAEGGESGARTAKELGIKVSPDTLLNQIRRAALPSHPIPKILGVDDWAMRKGQRYGTILVDLEHHVVIDLLPDRDSQTFANWLKANQGVEFISRDRGQSYAQGGRIGAPSAIHIADRFHLLQNLTDTIEELLIYHYKSLQTTAKLLAIEKAQAIQQDQAEVLATIPLDSLSSDPALVIQSKQDRDDESVDWHDTNRF